MGLSSRELSRRTLMAGSLAALLAPNAFAQDEALSFTVNDAGHVIAPIEINGEAGLAVIDNGFGITAMDANHARNRSLIGGQTVRINGGDTVKAVGVKLALGPLETLVTPALVDLSHIPAPDGAKVQMIIGRDVLALTILTLDFERKSYAATVGRGKFYPPGGMKLLRLSRTPQGAHAAQIEVEGEKIVAHVDLGASSPLMMREGPRTQAWIDGGRPWTTIARITARGRDMVTDMGMMASVQKASIGGFGFGHVPVEIYGPRDPAFGRHEAVIGAPVLARFLTVLDVRNSRLWLRPNGRLADPFRRQTIGAGTRREGEALVVVHIGANSPAEKAGLRDGDVITAIDGALANRDRLRDAKPGDVLALKLADGRTRKVTAAEFY
ncbi:MAG: PDZ domain-containing protein [Hyphomonadaceae bacterium]|nr:PDZ domain-containing protein [Hyphomonadaceae bacterium]